MSSLDDTEVDDNHPTGNKTAPIFNVYSGKILKPGVSEEGIQVKSMILCPTAGMFYRTQMIRVGKIWP